ncbi:hypothetical protein HY484_02600 [Candidatus Woesearchaeota archaeon]|nr:hypothetical protein [Candidatus Woesearchaeota archaeon]
MKKEIPKYGTQEVLQFVGLNQLSIEEQEAVNSISTKEYEKAKRTLKNTLSVVVHIKCYEKEGGRKKYSLHIRAIAPTKIIESCKSHDWDLPRAVHKSFQDIHKQIAHHFGTNATRPALLNKDKAKRRREFNLKGTDRPWRKNSIE